MKRLSLSALSCLLLLLGICSSGKAAVTFDNLVVFGDSLSDTGNVKRCSDGAIWVETLAQTLGATMYNYAYAGATTGYYNRAGEDYPEYSNTGLLWQVDNYDTAFLDSQTSLVTVWAGANDLYTGSCYVIAVENIKSALESLYSDGFLYFMVPNLPNIGATPFVYGTENSSVASSWTQAFNAALASMLATFSTTHTDAVIYDLDIYAVFETYEVGSGEWSGLFWTEDGFHPSSAGHAVIASIAARAVPVPQSALLLLTGFLGLALTIRKQQNASCPCYLKTGGVKS